MSDDSDSEADENEDNEELVEEEELVQLPGQIADESDGSCHLTASDDVTSWIAWFINLRGHDFFCEIDEDFIQDDFNLTGLHSLVPYYNYALDFILDVDIPPDLTEEQQEIVETAAKVLYGLIHARYILTARGMQRMLEKYQEAGFGHCPRVQCQDQFCLPLGLSDVQRCYPVNVYCPRCQELYTPKSTKHSGLDGAYFGTTFAHMFLLTYPELIPRTPVRDVSEAYVPKIYGFRIHKDSSYYKLRDFEAGREEEELFTESDRDSVGLSELPGQEESKINTTIEVDSRDARESRRRVEHAPLKHFNATKNDV